MYVMFLLFELWQLSGVEYSIFLGPKSRNLRSRFSFSFSFCPLSQQPNGAFNVFTLSSALVKREKENLPFLHFLLLFHIFSNQMSH